MIQQSLALTRMDFDQQRQLLETAGHNWCRWIEGGCSKGVVRTRNKVKKERCATLQCRERNLKTNIPTTTISRSGQDRLLSLGLDNSHIFLQLLTQPVILSGNTPTDTPTGTHTHTHMFTLSSSPQMAWPSPHLSSDCMEV